MSAAAKRYRHIMPGSRRRFQGKPRLIDPSIENLKRTDAVNGESDDVGEPCITFEVSFLDRRKRAIHSEEILLTSLELRRLAAWAEWQQEVRA